MSQRGKNATGSPQWKPTRSIKCKEDQLYKITLFFFDWHACVTNKREKPDVQTYSRGKKAQIFSPAPSPAGKCYLEKSHNLGDHIAAAP